MIARWVCGGRRAAAGSSTPRTHREPCPGDLRAAAARLRRDTEHLSRPDSPDYLEPVGQGYADGPAAAVAAAGCVPACDPGPPTADAQTTGGSAWHGSSHPPPGNLPHRREPHLREPHLRGPSRRGSHPREPHPRKPHPRKPHRRRRAPSRNSPVLHGQHATISNTELAPVGHYRTHSPARSSQGRAEEQDASASTRPHRYQSSAACRPVRRVGARNPRTAYA